MTTGLESSKIDGLVGIGLVAGEAGTKIDGVVALGLVKGIEITKLDSFSCLSQVVTQHEHLWTDQWIGPPAIL